MAIEVEIRIEVEDEAADAGNNTGLTEEAFNQLMDAIGSIGSLIEIQVVRD